MQVIVARRASVVQRQHVVVSVKSVPAIHVSVASAVRVAAAKQVSAVFPSVATVVDVLSAVAARSARSAVIASQFVMF